jgi:hypothetical protein
MTGETVTYIALAISFITLLYTLGEKLFGGGNALANKFHASERATALVVATLEKETTAAITAVRRELNDKIDEYEKVATVGFDAIRANIHAMQIGLLEFRAKMSDDLHHYIRKDDYNAGIGDIKRDVQNGFRNVEERLGQMQDLIMHVNPDLTSRQPGARKTPQ